MRVRIPLNRDWEFTERFDGAFLRGEPCAGTREAELPHTCAVTPYDYFDESVYQMHCGYRRRIAVPADWAEKRVFLTVGAAAHAATVYVDGRKLRQHRCGYTAFRTELTDALTPGKDALLVIEVDSRETLDQPPFGFVIDYMTYGGLYREAWLTVCGRDCIEDVFARPAVPDGLPLLSATERRELWPGLARELSFRGTLRSTVALSGPVTRSNAGYSLVQRVLDGEGGVLAEHILPLEVPAGERVETLFEVPGARLWDVESPALFTLETQLCRGTEIADCVRTRIGFRRTEWRADGFLLNGRRLKIVGMNRHQAYPFIGYAAPRSLQRLDAEILKHELGLNAVRTSHYPQSQHFIDRCDELGLLVFTEIPGWQHIGGALWKAQAVQNTGDMVRQYRNNPSVILWGVRINESADDDLLYAQTNAEAHRLDPTRPTGGVRAGKKGRLLEDVYTYNDFVHDGISPGCEKKRAVTPDISKPYLISEYNGHMFPTKTYDSEAHRTEHMLRHAAVLDAVAAEKDIAGSFGWCMADYNTHRDFGSGDRICYHGVLDMFRNPKLAAAVYAVRQDAEPVLVVTSAMELGERAASNRGRVFVLTNADEVRMYKGDRLIRTYTHRDSPFRSMDRPPIEIGDFVGDQLAEREPFTPRQAALVKELLNYAAIHGFAHLPPQILAKGAVLMTRYGMRFEDAYTLYGKYIGNWGEAAGAFRFEAVKGGSVVKTVVKEPFTSLHLSAKPSSTQLHEGETWDAALVRLSMRDQNGNVLPFYQGAVHITVTGPLACIGAPEAILRGGLGGILLRTTGDAGEASIRLETAQTEPITITFTITKDEGEIIL